MHQRSISKPGKKPAKCDDQPVKHIPIIPFDNRFAFDEEMSTRVAAMHLR